MAAMHDDRTRTASACRSARRQLMPCMCRELLPRPEVPPMRKLSSGLLLRKSVKAEAASPFSAGTVPAVPAS
eukprot:251863-Chlamydomonas_euryale.AAC.15